MNATLKRRNSLLLGMYVAPAGRLLMGLAAFSGVAGASYLSAAASQTRGRQWSINCSLFMKRA